MERTFFFSFMCVGGSLEQAYWYEYKLTVIRNNNHTKNWEILAQITGQTRAVCENTLTPRYHNSKKTSPPPPQSISLFWVCALCGKQAAVYNFLSSSHRCWATTRKKKKLSLLFSLPLSQWRKLLLLMEGQSWTAVWEKVREWSDKSLWGFFIFSFLTPKSSPQFLRAD